MSLTARIAVVPSRRLDHAADLLAGGGVLVATAACAARWPDGLGAVVAVALVAAGAGIVTQRHRGRSASGFTMHVSDRDEVEVEVASSSASASARVADDSARLTGATLVWPGFVVVALRSVAAPGTRASTRIVPLLDRELALPERRALRRFLTWSLHGGAGRAPASSSSADPR